MKVLCQVEGPFDTFIVIQFMGDLLLTTVSISISVRFMRLLYKKPMQRITSFLRGSA